MSTLGQSVLVFPEERAVFLKEENSKLYTTLSYFIGRTLVDLPILLITPIIFSAVIYWMVGLDDTPSSKFFIFMIVALTQALNGDSFGLMVGSMFVSSVLASALVNIMIMPFMLFSGMYANRSTLNFLFSWIEYISPFKYAFESLVQNEFKGSKYILNAVDLLSFDFGLWESILVNFLLFVCFRTFACVFLYLLRQRVQ